MHYLLEDQYQRDIVSALQEVPELKGKKFLIQYAQTRNEGKRIVLTDKKNQLFFRRYAAIGVDKTFRGLFVLEVDLESANTEIFQRLSNTVGYPVLNAKTSEVVAYPDFTQFREKRPKAP